MKKKKVVKNNTQPSELKNDEIIKTDLTFEELMKKALNTPLPKQKKIKK